MVTSSLHGHVVSHVFSGNLDLRDLAEARNFVETHVTGGAGQPSPQQPFAVLWDLRDAGISEVDSYYETISRMVIDPKSASPVNKRAFLVTPATESLATSVLSNTNPPWPWAVFVAEEEALAWLAP